MALTDAGIRALKPITKEFTVADGKGLAPPARPAATTVQWSPAKADCG